MRRLTLQPSLLLLSLLPKWKFRQLNIFLAFHNSAWKNGRISGTVVRGTSFMLFTQTLVEFHTVKTCPGARQWSLTDYELVILALRTCTCLHPKIYQHVSFAIFHSLLITYFWNVLTWTLPGNDSSGSRPLRISLIELTNNYWFYQRNSFLCSCIIFVIVVFY